MATVTKMSSRRRRGQRRRSGVFLGGLLAIIIGLIVIPLLMATFLAPSELALHASKILLPQHRDSPKDWILQGDESPLLERDVAIAKRFGAMVAEVLEPESDIPEVDALKGMFLGKVYVAYYDRGSIRHILEPGTSFAAYSEFRQDPHSLTFALYGRSSRHTIRTTFSYQYSLRAVLMPALDYSDPVWRNAYIVHELFHAKRHREENFRRSPNMSKAWIGEELEAHRIVALILDRGTGGQYLEIVRDIVNQRSAGTVKHFLLAIKAEDIQRLNGLFRPAGVDTDARNGQFITDLVREWLRQRYAGEKFREQEIKAYEFVERQLSPV